MVFRIRSLFFSPAGQRPPIHVRSALLGFLPAIVAAALLLAAPAGAFVSGEFGLQRREPTFARSGPLQYHGGPVIHAEDIYAIYWDPLELYNSQWMKLIDGYFRNVGEASGAEGNVFALNAQYGETGYATGPGASASAKAAHAADQSTFRGAYTDTDSYPTSGNCTESAEVVCLTDQEIKAELQKVIASGALPGATGTVPGAQSTPVYYILTPPGVTVCAGASSSATCSDSAALETESQEIKEGKVIHPSETGICGYHSTIDPHSNSPIVYAVQPWVAGYAGLYSGALPTADVLACQDDKSLEEPNQNGENPFSFYGGALADVIVNDLAYEQSDLVVNPLLNGWYQNASAEEGGDPEQADMCKFSFNNPEPPSPDPETDAASVSNEEIGAGAYYIHWAFNSSGFITGKDTAGCWQGVDLEPHITAPSPVKAGDVVTLDANESGITLDAAPLDLRVHKEETRLADEVTSLVDQAAAIGVEVKKIETKEAELASEIADLEFAIPALEGEVARLKKEEQRIASEEAALVQERKEAEEHKELTTTKKEELARIETQLKSEQERVVKEIATDENDKAADEANLKAALAKERYETEQRAVAQKDKRIVEGDQTLAQEEEKLADEHRLIGEREPFQAPIYKWDFGYQENSKQVTEEGEEKASVLHTFPCAGTYTVGLTVVDGGGFEGDLGEAVDKTIAVEGKSCEGSSPEGGAGGGPGNSTQAASTGGSSSAGTSSPSASPTAKPQAPAPVAAQAIVSKSLAEAVKKGLVVKYKVNEQVTGSFNVLLAATLAKRLHLRLPLATGLPAGTPPQEIVGRALLITTKGGHGTIKIELSKTAGARIRKLGKVSLMLQLNLRNASGGTTTVLSKLTLH